MIFDLLSVCVI